MTDAALNTDREIWREREDDYYADSIHVTENSGIGINCGGMVYVRPVREWHRLAAQAESAVSETQAQFTEGELNALIDYHDNNDAAADAMEMPESSLYHAKRSAHFTEMLSALKAEEQRVLKGYLEK